MKILLITDDFLPHMGGSRLYYYNIFRLFPSGETVVLTKKVPGSGSFDRHEDILRIVRVPLPLLKIKKIGDILIYINLLAASIGIFFKFRPDIIHCGEVLPSGFVGLLLSRLFNRPYIVYLHNNEMTYDTFRGEKYVFYRVLKNAHCIITACNFVRDYFMEKLPEKRMVLVNPGITKDFNHIGGFDPQRFKTSLGLKDTRVILTVARLVRRKGIDNVIRVLPRLIGKYGDLMYIVIGEGPDQERIVALAEDLKVSRKVTIKGVLGQDKIKKYYSISDVFIMPNREEAFGDIEGFGMVFLEAQSFGKPVIGGRSGGVSDSIVDNVTGLLVDPNDLDQIEKAIDRLLSDKGFADQLGSSGRKRALEEFCWDKKAKDVYLLSEQIVREFHQRKIDRA